MRNRGAGGLLVTMMGVTAACAATQAPSAPIAHVTKAPAGVELAAPAVSAYLGPARGLGAMTGVRPTRMGDALAKAGLDVANLPPLESLSPGAKQRVMRTFSESLGLPCVDCHAEDDFTADTRRKRVAKRMWNDFVRVLQTHDGKPIYCDSCHDGALFHLDRRDKVKLATYMCNSMVDGLRRSDGRDHDCTTCHGDPPDFTIIALWKQARAPDIVFEGMKKKPPEGSLVERPMWPTAGVREPRDCGPDGVLCPVLHVMRNEVAPAVAIHDDAWLSRALAKVATFSPDPAWASIANRGAAGASSHDPQTTRDACLDCHNRFKSEWREKSRTLGAR